MRYVAIAKEQNAVYDVQLTIPPDIVFPDDELCIILSNLLENTMDAASQQVDGDKRVYLRGELLNYRLGFVANNTFNGEIKQKNGIFLSTKHEGQGLRSIQTIVEKYDGIVDFFADDGIFRVTIFIPLRNL